MSCPSLIRGGHGLLLDMSSDKNHLGGLLTFLDRTRAKGWLNASTAAALKSTAGRIGEVLEEREKQDLSQLNVDDVIRRFGNLNPDVAPDSLKTYRSRMSKAIELFAAYNEDPVNWQPPASSGTPRRKAKVSSRDGDESRTKQPLKAVASSHAAPSSSVTSTSGFTYPFPLRDNVTIMISNLPRDIKSNEVERVCAFLRSLAVDFSP